MTLNRFFKIRLSSPDGTIVYNIDGTTPGLGIAESSMHLEEILCDEELEIGNCTSNKFEVQIYGLTNDVSGYDIVVYNDYNTQSPEYVFKGIVDSSETDKYNQYRSIVAYDKMYQVRDVNVGDWWNDFWNVTDSTTLKELRDSMCEYVGLDVATNQVCYNDNLVIYANEGIAPVPVPSGLFITSHDRIFHTVYDETFLVDMDETEDPTAPLDIGIIAPSISQAKFGTLLRMMCELQCCCPNINRVGELEFITIADSSATPLNVDNLYDTNNTEFQDYTTDAPTGFSVYDTSESLAQVVPALDNDNPYPISGNVFLLSMSASQIYTVLEVLVPVIEKIVYKPVTMPLIVSDLSIKLGDKLTSTHQGTTSSHFVLSQTLSGSLLVNQTISSPAYSKQLNNKASEVSDIMAQGLKISQISHTIDDVTIRVGVQGAVSKSKYVLNTHSPSYGMSEASQLTALTSGLIFVPIITYSESGAVTQTFTRGYSYVWNATQHTWSSSGTVTFSSTVPTGTDGDLWCCTGDIDIYKTDTLYLMADGWVAVADTRGNYSIDSVSQLSVKADSISMKVSQVVDEDNEIKSADIMLAINDDTSSVTISADKLNLSGYVTITGLSGGTTTIDGACIQTGTISASRIDAQNLHVNAVNIDGAIEVKDTNNVTIFSADADTHSLVVDAKDTSGNTAFSIDSTGKTVTMAGWTATQNYFGTVSGSPVSGTYRGIKLLSPNYSPSVDSARDKNSWIASYDNYGTAAFKVCRDGTVYSQSINAIDGFFGGVVVSPKTFARLGNVTINDNTIFASAIAATDVYLGTESLGYRGHTDVENYTFVGYGVSVLQRDQSGTVVKVQVRTNGYMNVLADCDVVATVTDGTNTLNVPVTIHKGQWYGAGAASIDIRLGSSLTIDHITPSSMSNVTGNATEAIYCTTNFVPFDDTTQNLGDSNYYWNNGYINHVYTNNAISTSDSRLKTDISYDLSKYDGVIDNLKPASYKFKTDSSTHLGFIAQDVEKVADNLVNKENTFMGLYYNDLHALEVMEIQKLKKQVSILEDTVKKLEQRLNELSK